LLQEPSEGQEKRKELFVESNSGNYIHQVEYNCDKGENAPKILMIHGFGASGCVFYKMIKYLMSEFRVTTIDLLGMGCSGRPPYSLTTAQESIDFFLLSIEAWMQAVSYKTSEYILLGHSLGGYLAANYAI
jgi:cardiolipin-specific phospholipase